MKWSRSCTSPCKTCDIQTNCGPSKAYCVWTVWPSWMRLGSGSSTPPSQFQVAACTEEELWSLSWTPRQVWSHTGQASEPVSSWQSDTTALNCFTAVRAISRATQERNPALNKPNTASVLYWWVGGELLNLSLILIKTGVQQSHVSLTQFFKCSLKNNN